MGRNNTPGFLILLALASVCTTSSVLNSSLLFLDGINPFVISFDNYDSEDERVFDRLVTLARNSTVTIDLIDLPSSVSFLIVQIHAYQYNLTISYDDILTPRLSAVGMNLGLFVVNKIEGENTGASVYIRNDNNVDVQALLATVGYPSSAPVPGGCNMEFDTEIAPYQRLSVTESTVVVDMQPAAAGNSNLCDGNRVEHEVYRLYLPEQDFSVETYFSSIRKTLTVEGIRANGNQIPSSAIGSKMRRTYSAYPGTGSVFAAVAILGNQRAAYVPTFTYACSPLNETDNCQVLTSPFSKIVCAAAFFLGLFAAFLGHKYFKTEMFLLGFLSGGLLSYVVVVSLFGDYGTSGNIAVSVFLGCLLGLVWLGIWWFYAIPVLPILLATLTLGSFCASIAYFSSPAGLSYLENDVNFWLIFSVIMVSVPLVLSVVPDSVNIVCCAILGSYATVISVDHYAGSNLKYIIINVVRRATSPGFNLAVVCPPYQLADICLTCCWLLIAVAGVYVQLKRNRGKPPFPPGMQSGRIFPTERTPLILDSAGPVAQPTTIGNLQNDNGSVYETRSGRYWYSKLGFLKTLNR